MINENAKFILEQLEKAGFEAYLVGGCVRDMIMGRQLHDYDITTNALPEQITSVFSGHKVIPTGLKHGTVTILIDHEPFEVTTYRIDGEYTDSRRPDSVTFTSDLTADLARRDFTINAIAMNSSGELFDPFGGRSDIENRIIRCVGEPEKRFTEDALRILRAVRFASVLGFEIEEKTSDAALRLREKLDNISRERIREELTKLICGRDVVEIMLKYRDIFAQVIPELIPCFDLDQHSPYHKYDVYEHTVRAVSAMPEDDPLLRTTMLYHDLGKPPTFKLDETGRGHFQHHAEVGAEIARDIMHRLRYDNRTIHDVYILIRWHSEHFFNEKDMKKMLAEVGPELFRKLIQVKKADNMAKREFVLNENRWFDRCAKMAEELVENGFCLTMKQLAVDGRDMIELGLQNDRIGSTLSELLRKVIAEELPNDREALISYVRAQLPEVAQ